MINRTQEQIMALWEDCDKPLVSIKCLTYNHEVYIEQALDSFLSQITTFSFEIIVHDDASTDGTAEIIHKYQQKYPKIIYPIYQVENQYSKNNGSIRKILNSKIRGRFVANCEGDDYWIDQYKLQKQYDFMIKNPEYLICYTNFCIYDQTNCKLSRKIITENCVEYPIEPNLEEWIVYRGYTAPMTWFYRQSVFLKYESLGSLDGSFELFAHFLNNGKSKCMVDEVTAVYRKLRESASHSSDCNKYYNRIKSLRDVQLAMVDKYSLDSNLKEIILCNYYCSSYKFICATNDLVEKKMARKYCSRFIAKSIIYLSDFKIFRCLLKALYNLRH